MTWIGSDAGADTFRLALDSLRSVQFRPEVVVSESPAPQRLAPHAVALVAEIVDDAEEEAASGRLVVLHDPGAPQAWEGDFRIVALVRATLEPEMAADPMLTDVGWAWLLEPLADRRAPYACLGGTVTRTTSVSYGELGDRPVEGQVEIRASWTPAGPDLAAHALAWADALAAAAGLPPLLDGVAALRRRRGR